jgi:uncharacterized protein YecT (DUF1311 family)
MRDNSLQHGRTAQSSHSEGIMKRTFTAMLLITGAAFGGEANTPPTAAADCWKAVNSAEVRSCFATALPRAEAELGRQVVAASQYFKRLALADESKVRKAWLNTAASELIRAQRAWRQYRDAHCASFDGTITGNDHGSAAIRCKLELTTARIKEVMSYGGSGAQGA